MFSHCNNYKGNMFLNVWSTLYCIHKILIHYPFKQLCVTGVTGTDGRNGTKTTTTTSEGDRGVHLKQLESWPFWDETVQNISTQICDINSSSETWMLHTHTEN